MGIVSFFRNLFKSKKEEQKKVRKRWVEALRSGKYKQCKGYLSKTDGTFCVLGVLSDLYVQDGHAKWKAPSYDGHPFNYLQTGSAYPIYGSLATEVKRWAGLKDIAGGFDNNGKRASLMTMNDVLGLSFKDLADIIEKEPKDLVE